MSNKDKTDVVNSDDDVSYLEINKEDAVKIPAPEAAWAKIGENLELEYINWGIVNKFAAEFDELTRSGKDKSNSHVMCKLISLVRKVSLQEGEAIARLEYEKNG